MSYFIFDIESTGLSTRYHSIIQLSGVLVDEDYQILDEFNEYCRPHTFSNWSEDAEEIHGITRSEAEGFQDGHVLLHKLKQFLRQEHTAIVHAAHRTNFYKFFDYQMLRELCLLHNFYHEIIYGRLPFCQSTILSKTDFNHSNRPVNQKLNSWADFLDIQFKHHRADEDAKVTLEVMKYQDQSWGRKFGRSND